MSDWLSVLEAACHGESGGCCQVFNEDGSCCMTERVRETFRLIAEAGGPTLEECEDIAVGKLLIVKPTHRGIL